MTRKKGRSNFYKLELVFKIDQMKYLPTKALLI